MSQIKKVTVTTVEIGIDDLISIILKEAGVSDDAVIRFLGEENDNLNIKLVQVVHKQEKAINKTLTRADKIDPFQRLVRSHD